MIYIYIYILNNIIIVYNYTYTEQKEISKTIYVYNLFWFYFIVDCLQRSWTRMIEKTKQKSSCAKQ